MILFWVVVAPVITIGLLCIYMAYRFCRNGKGIVDQTAGFLSFFFVMWTCTTQTELVAKCMPFVSQDLTEFIGFRKDDGEIT